MSDADRARILLAMSRKDLDALRAMGESPAFAEEIFGFHAQQAIEKALKAWIAALGRTYPITHNLVALLRVLEECGSEIEPYWDLVRFNTFAVQFRYEPFEELDVRLDRPEVVRQVAALLDDVQRVVNG